MSAGGAVRGRNVLIYITAAANSKIKLPATIVAKRFIVSYERQILLVGGCFLQRLGNTQPADDQQAQI